jgi:hypothetical protein
MMSKDYLLKFRGSYYYLHTALTFLYRSSGHNTGGRKLLSRTTPSARYKPDKADEFLEYWELRKALASGATGLKDGLELLNMFTSNNSETLNSATSINVVTDAARGLPWVDYVTHLLSACRTFFYLGKEHNAGRLQQKVRVIAFLCSRLYFCLLPPSH